MTRADAIAKLQAHAGALRAMGATAVFLYGSTLRNAAGPQSDIDLFIDYDSASRFNAFDLVGIKQFLEGQLDASIDLTTRDSLHPRLRSNIEHAAVRVF